MDKTIKLILLTNSERLISESIQIVPEDIGDANCKLTNPYEIWAEHNLVPWMKDDTDQTEFMINSDKIITMVDPKKELLEKYLEKIS